MSSVEYFAVVELKNCVLESDVDKSVRIDVVFGVVVRTEVSFVLL